MSLLIAGGESFSAMESVVALDVFPTGEGIHRETRLQVSARSPPHRCASARRMVSDDPAN